MSRQLTLLDLIKDVTDQNSCELCGQPSKGSIHPECSEKWWDKIVMKIFKNKEDER